VAGLSKPAHFCGIEQRPHLVSVARATVQLLAVPRVTFAHGNIMGFDWSGFDGFYLYNPFAENVTAMCAPVDGDVEVAPQLLQIYADFVRRQLSSAKPGARVVTYHGFGGEMPDSYTLMHREPAHTDCLELWVKRDSRKAG
jgi:hypothetical protein